MLFDLIIGLIGVALFIGVVLVLDILCDTRIGSNFINWFSKRFFDTDLETMED